MRSVYWRIGGGAIGAVSTEVTRGEGVFFSGGFGHDYIQYAADLFAKVHPGSTMSVEPIQGVGEKLRPRFVGGNPPDVIDNSGAGSLDFGALVSEGQLMELSALLDAPSLDTPGKTVRDTLYPGSQDGSMIDMLEPISGETIIANPERIPELEAWARLHPGGSLHYRYDCSNTILLAYQVP